MEYVITHIDGSDWHWYYVNGDLVTEGHSEDNGIAKLILEKMSDGPYLLIYQYAFIEADLATRASMRANTLAEFIELGLAINEFDVELLVNNIDEEIEC